MFETIRTHRRWLQFILLLLIVPSFALVGVQSYTHFIDSEPELATVAGQGIKRSEFDNAHRNQLEQFRQRMGTRFDPVLVDTPRLREELLNQMIDQRLLAQVAIDNRFSVSDETLRNYIASIPAVQDEGRFSPERYRQVLAAQGISTSAFENSMRRDLALARVVGPVDQSASAPQVVVDDVLQALTQKRTVQLRTFAAADFRSKVTVTPEDVQAWYDANKESLRVPEQVQAQYIVLDEAAATAGVQVSDDDVKTYYEQNKGRFGTLEQRRVSHIQLLVAPGASDADRKAARAKADQIAAQAAANPAGFADLAKKESQDAGSAAQGGDLGWVVNSALPPSLQQAISGLAKDAVSGVVESPDGLHILKVTDIKPAQVKPLAEVKEQIVAEIRRQKASARFGEMAEKLQGAVYDQRDSLQPAADALGLKLRTAAGITRTGLLPADQAGAGAAVSSPDAQLLDNPRVREALFTGDVLRDKQNTGMITLSTDTMIALRVASQQPSQIPPLDKVKDSIRARLLDERATQAARQAGEEAAKALESATAPEGFESPLTVSRQEPGNLDRNILDAIMRVDAKKLPAYTGVVSGKDYVVARVEKVEAGQTDAETSARLGQQLSGAWGAAEDQAVLKTLRELYKVKVLPPGEAAIKGDQPAEG